MVFPRHPSPSAAQPADIIAGTSFSPQVLTEPLDRGVDLLAENLLHPTLPEPVARQEEPSGPHPMMHHVKKSEVVPYSPSEMFKLVADVDRYEEFLPWCSGSRVLEHHGGNVLAELQVAYGPIKTAFTTRNRNHPNRMIEMHLVDGPLKHLEGAWQFKALPEGGTLVSLELQFQLHHSLLAVVEETFLQEAVEVMVSAFRERAGEVYGEARQGHGRRKHEKAG